MKISLSTLLLALVSVWVAAPVAHAQSVDPVPSQRQLRTYIPPDQVVSFLPGTPMSEFVTLLNPIFERVTGKQVIDPEGRTTPIGVSLSGMHFIDAFELVLDRQRLGFRETDNYFIVEALPEDGEEVQLVGTDGVSSRAEGAAPPATALSREIRIDAYIFELNVTRLRDTGTNWTTVFGGEAGGTSSASASGGAGSGGVQAGLNFELKTDSFFDSFSTFLEGPDRVNFKEIVSLFRYFESIDVGETIASPSVAVQSGETGRIQSGSDIPVTIQDFAGNTITQYIPTGVIIEVVPTLIADASDQRDDPEALPVEFIHLDVNVEKSSGRISSAGVTIDKNKTDTQVLLLDGEQTVIGGLFSTEEATFRKGIPILKSIPLVKYLFSYQSKSVVQKELLIALQARVVEPLRARAGRPYPTNLYERERQDIQRRLDRFKPGAGDDFDLIEAGEMD
jgi:type IV pilus assembly protein PilQ